MIICLRCLGAPLKMRQQIIKNGTVVDAECPLGEVAHVWKDENGFFNFYKIFEFLKGVLRCLEIH